MKWRDYPFKSKVYLVFFWIVFVLAVAADVVGKENLSYVLVGVCLVYIAMAAAEGAVRPIRTEDKL